VERDLHALYALFERAWDADTSYCPDYVLRAHFGGLPRSYGQCAVTSLVLYDLLGGQCLTSVVSFDGEEVRHYAFRTTGGVFIDWTWDQFPPWAVQTKPRWAPREMLLPTGNRWMEERYELLKARVTSDAPST
jgi:hypothetical protein